MRVGIVGATGLVGRNMLSILEERNFPVDELYLFGSGRVKTHRELIFKGESLPVEPIGDNIPHLDLALFSAGSEVSRRIAPLFVENGAVVIDNSSAFRMEKNIPLIVPEVNIDAVKESDRLIANPNCSTIELVLVLHYLRELSRLVRVDVVTMQATSGAGRKGLSAMFIEDYSQSPFQKDIFENLIPQIGEFSTGGFCEEEQKIIFESRKILGEPELRLLATTVRVPVRNAHSEAVTIEFEHKVSIEDIRNVLSDAPGISITDNIPTPRDADGKDDVFVGRIRKAMFSDRIVLLWIVADNLRKGAALNAIQIAEKLL